MKISVIIPNYNGDKILVKNLPKVLESLVNLNNVLEIIITDDASTDASIEVIEKFIEESKDRKIKLIKNEKNMGFATNVNKGVKESEGDVLVLLNTDVIPSNDFLDPILPYFEDEEVFAVGCMDESIEGDKTVLRGRGKGKWKRGLLTHSAADLSGKDTLWVAGGSGVFRKSIWEKLGGLDIIYNPFYWEDIDISYRARKSGYKTFFEKKSIVRHEHEKGAIKSKFKSDQIKKIAYRNQFIFAWKNSDFSTFISGIFWLPYHLLNAVISKDYSLIFGFINALKLTPKILAHRRVSQKYFIKSDNDVVLGIGY